MVLFLFSLVMATFLEVGSYTSHLQFGVVLSDSVLHHFQADVCLLNSFETLKFLVAFSYPNISTSSSSLPFFTGQTFNHVVQLKIPS